MGVAETLKEFPSLTALLCKSDEESTFMHEQDLPDLPLPSLDETMQKLLAACGAVLTPAQLREAHRAVEDFRQGEGAVLQAVLERRAAGSRNWLSDWWLQHAYLTFRGALIPNLNAGGALPVARALAMPDANVYMAALIVFAQAVFWKCLREEIVAPEFSSKGVALSMEQFRGLYNTCRLPGETRDTLHRVWQPCSSGPCPSHFTVLCRGHVWTLQALHTDGTLVRPCELAMQLRTILRQSRTAGPGVAVLTSDDRPGWAQNRQYLSSLSAANQRHLAAIEDSISVVVLDDARPTNDSQAGWLALCGDSSNRWADKSVTSIVTKNGVVASNAEHTPYDAMTLVLMQKFQLTVVKDLKIPQVFLEGARKNLVPPTHLKFDLDAKLLATIESVKQNSQAANANVLVDYTVFKDYGHDFIKGHGFHPDAYMQMALHLAYYRAHGKMAPTYETATTRQYHHGRTETMRSCTLEAKAFVTAAVTLYRSSPYEASTEHRGGKGRGTTTNIPHHNIKTETIGSNDDTAAPGDKDSIFSTSHVAALLRTACRRHVTGMAECQAGRGVDRHLLGLQVAAAEAGMPTPGLFQSPAHLETGGGATFSLSTSTVGKSGNVGGAAPMVPGGYGAFYSMDGTKICLFVSSFRDGGSLPAPEFGGAVREALVVIGGVLGECRASL